MKMQSIFEILTRTSVVLWTWDTILHFWKSVSFKHFVLYFLAVQPLTEYWFGFKTHDIFENRKDRFDVR